MRMTNAMTANRLLLNLNRSSRTLDRLQMQLSSGKKIQNPSENPIIASRALRFRTNISEATQHQRNNIQGQNWMSLSDQAMKNMTQVVDRINVLLVQGASDTYQYDDRQKIMAEIEMLFEQLGTEMNGTLAGRYLFSGFRTNLPPIISRNDADAHFGITKTIGNNDIARGVLRAWVPLDGTPPQQRAVNVVRIPFEGVNSINLPGFEVHTMSMHGSVNPFDMTNFNTQFIGDPPMPNPDYDAAGMRVHFIPETGELIFSNRAAERFIVGGNVPFSVPVRPTAPNPDDFGVDPADLDAAWLAAMAGDYADLSAEWATLRAEVETRWNDVFANYFYDFIEHGFDPFRFLLMPSQPAPPDPNGSFNFANYAAAMRDHFQYIEDGLAVFDDFLTDFQTFLAAFDPDAIPLLAPPAPPPVATSAAPQTTDFRTTPDVFVHNDANPAVSRFLNAFETYMASVAHYVRDMEQQQHMHDQFQNFPFAGGFTMSFSVQGVNIGELNPLIYFNTIDFNSPATDENGIVIPNRFSHFDQANQEMQFEFGTNVRLTVNAQARNIYSWQMFSDMQALVQGINAVRLSDAGELRLHYAGLNPGISAADLELLVEERLVYERDLYRVVMREKFSHMLGRMEIHAAQLVTEYTTLGSRLNRLELIYERLDENLDTLTDLMSQNENVDILEVLMRLNAAEAILQAAMQVGARINQLSLVNFI